MSQPTFRPFHQAWFVKASKGLTTHSFKLDVLIDMILSIHANYRLEIFKTCMKHTNTLKLKKRGMLLFGPLSWYSSRPKL